MKLIQHGNLSIGEFGTLTQVKADGIDHLDVVAVNGQIEGGIYCPHSTRWHGFLDGCHEPLDFIRSSNELKQAEKGMAHLTQHGYRFSIDDLTDQNYPHFLRLYEQEIESRDRALKVNVYDQSLGKSVAGLKTLLLGAYEHDRLKGALVCFIKRNELYVTVGAKERVQGIKGGLGGILEFMLLDYALKHQVIQIYHGISLNPVGLIAKAGLFEFKARYGYSAYPHGRWHTLWIVNPEAVISDLVFLTLHHGQLSYLVISDEPTSTVMSKYTTRDITSVTHLPRHALLTQKDNLLQLLA